MKCETDLISQTKKMSKKCPPELRQHTKSLVAEAMETTIAFKKFYAECSKANINTQPLTKLLSTIYGFALVEKGMLALLSERISNTPLLMDRKKMQFLIEEIQEANHLQEWTASDCLESLATGSIEVVT